MDIKLSPIDEVNIDLLKKWQNDVNVKYPLMGFRFPIQKKTAKLWQDKVSKENPKLIERWLEKIRQDNGVARVVYGIKISNVAIGLASLNDINYINRSALLGIFIAENNRKNKGIGTKATILILDFAFNAIGLKRVGLEVLKNNKNAIRMYKKVGFIKEGTKRKAFFRNGSFLDVEIMSILKSEFKINKKSIANRLV